MSLNPAPKALFFDVFGTCVDWRKTVTDALYHTAESTGGTKMVNRPTHHLSLDLR